MARVPLPRTEEFGRAADASAAVAVVVTLPTLNPMRAVAARTADRRSRRDAFTEGGLLGVILSLVENAVLHLGSVRDCPPNREAVGATFGRCAGYFPVCCIDPCTRSSTSGSDGRTGLGGSSAAVPATTNGSTNTQGIERITTPSVVAGVSAASGAPPWRAFGN